MKCVSFVPTHKEVASHLSWQKSVPGACELGPGGWAGDSILPTCTLRAELRDWLPINCAKTRFDQWRGNLPLTKFVPDAL